MSDPCGMPYWSQLRLPSTVGHVPLCSVLVIVWLSIEPVFAATDWISCPTAYASADVESIPKASPPYLVVYALMKSWFPLAFELGNQSPQLKMPLTLFAPTFDGNSTGELAPFDRYRNFGLKFSEIIDLICAEASSDCVPPTHMSGLVAATGETVGVKFVASGWYIVLATVWMPAASNFACIASAIGD